MTTAGQDISSDTLRTAPLGATATFDTESAASRADGTLGHRSRLWQRRLAARVALADTVATGVAAAAAVLLVSPGPLAATDIAASDRTLAALALAAIVGWLGVAAMARRRDRGLTVDGLVRYLPPVASAGTSFALTCVILALAGATLPLALVTVPFVAGAAAGLAGRAVVRRWATTAHTAGLGQRTVLLIGSSAEVSALGPALTAIGSAIDVLGACVTDDAPESQILLDYGAHSQASVRTLPVLGTVDRAHEIAASLGVDTVLLASARHAKNGDLSALAWQLDEIGTTLSILSSTNDIDDSRVKREVIGSTTLVHIARPAYRGALKATKRVADVAISALALAVAGLPMLAIAATIRLSSKGRALFTQERVGLGGKHFTMLKFRSMVADAEDRLPGLEAVQDAGNAVMFKMKDDPRVTAIGRLLRKTSLDELPQLINVLRGDMSLVGPRPPLPAELKQYDETARRRFLVKPGITGLWQVSGRSDLTWEQTVRCDRRYVENWSVSKDATILVRTVRAMNKGAY